MPSEQEKMPSSETSTGTTAPAAAPAPPAAAAPIAPPAPAHTGAKPTHAFGGKRQRFDRPGNRQNKREPSEYEEEVLQIDRVTRVVKGGRRLRFRATVVVGNKNGKVGIGIGKSHEVIGAIQKAISKAKKDIVLVPLMKGTIPHDIKVKFKSARILLFPASPGTGIIAGGAVRKIAELAGIKNLLSKMLGGSNRITNAKATMIALRTLKPVKRPESKEPKEPLVYP